MVKGRAAKRKYIIGLHFNSYLPNQTREALPKIEAIVKIGLLFAVQQYL